MRKNVQILIGGNTPTVKYDTDIDLNDGDHVIVESPNGAEWGIVSGGTSEPKGKQGGNNLILRIADQKDMAVIEELKKLATEAIKTTAERVEKYNLDMKPLCAHYTLDKSKVIVQFSAAQRVDFRELVRDLAHSLRTRIELKQIGSRDEVKVIGALGSCGMQCCCARFKEDFENITIKMAKTQGLSLNPQKINGMCGRLLCCLGYENNHYVETLEKMPRYGQEVNTPDGKGIAQDNNVVKETVNVKFTQGDTHKTGCYKLCDINCKGGCRKHGN